MTAMFARTHHFLFVYWLTAISVGTRLGSYLEAVLDITRAHLGILSLLFAGSKNPKITLKLAEFKTDSKGKVSRTMGYCSGGLTASEAL